MFNDKVILVTGTGPNIGGEIARTFAASGAKVVCLDARPEMATATANEITSTGAEALAITADITNPDDVARAVQSAVNTFGGLHVLINNAAISPLGSLLDTKMDDWHAALNVILTGTFLCSRFAAKQMIKQNAGGVIINIASTSGHRGKSGHIAYATAKGGVLQLTRCMAMELAAHGIRVNSVSPNSSGTPLAGSAKSREGKPPRAPLGRWGRTTDQARAVLFMASPNADFITGTDLAVDGGVLSGRP